MEYQNIKYIDPKKLLVVKRNGILAQLHVPIAVLVNTQLTDSLPTGTLVYVDEIMPHQKHTIIYKIFNQWYPYWAFRIK